MIAMWVSYRNVLRYVQILAYAVSNLYEGRKCIAIGLVIEGSGLFVEIGMIVCLVQY